MVRVSQAKTSAGASPYLLSDGLGIQRILTQHAVVDWHGPPSEHIESTLTSESFHGCLAIL